ncbi:MAG: glycosyltransferase family 2 protein [Duncaniella sp.]|nr:glycosyltransferase family 2 protein [Duncaniella sp.]
MVSVSIVTYHTPLSELDTCLRSLDCREVARIYVIDNSRDRLIEEWAVSHPAIIYIANDNTGYGAGHNIALRRELDRDDCEFHLVMNSDLEFEPQAISDIHRYMLAHPDAGTLQPRMTDSDGTKQYTCRRLPSPADVFIRRFLPKQFFKSMRDKYLLKHLDDTMTWDIPYHQGSFMFLRKDALRAAGLFDERFFMYPEDIDLTRRIHRHYRTLYWPGVTITHHHRAASYHSPRMLWIHVTNMISYFNKWGWLRDEERRRMNDEISRYQ